MSVPIPIFVGLIVLILVVVVIAGLIQMARNDERDAYLDTTAGLQRALGEANALRDNNTVLRGELAILSRGRETNNARINESEGSTDARSIPPA